MLTIADAGRPVTGGVDTHAEVHVAGMVDQTGRVLGAKEFPATAAGYAAALAWMRGHGELARIGVEGTGSYGAALAGAKPITAQQVATTSASKPRAGDDTMATSQRIMATSSGRTLNPTHRRRGYGSPGQRRARRERRGRHRAGRCQDRTIRPRCTGHRPAA